MTDERDPRDRNVETAWREHVRDEPPSALDDAIRAAAHRAVQSGPRAAGTSRNRAWTAWAPLAVAATLGAIALGVVQLVPRDTDATHEVVSDAAPSDSASANAPSRTPRPSAVERPSVPAAPPAAPPAPPATSATMAAAPVTQPSTSSSRPAATPPPPVASARKNETDHEARPSAAERGSAVGAVSPRDANAQSHAQSANRAQAEKLAARQAPDPFPAAGTDRPAEAIDKPDPKRAMAGNRMDSASRDAPAAASPSVPAAPARNEQPTEPVVDALRRKDAAPFAEPPGDRAGLPAAAPAQPAPAPRAASSVAPSTSQGAGAQALTKTAPLRTPDDYFSAIRRLRDEGREADAIAMLAAYRSAFGDDEQKLPGDLRLWAMRVMRP